MSEVSYDERSCCWWLCGAISACSLVEEATTFTFCSDPSEFVFDSDDLGLKGTGQTFPVVTCEGPEDVRVQAPGSAATATPRSAQSSVPSTIPSDNAICW